MEIIGISPTSFTGKDGTKVTGNTIFLSYPLGSKGQGIGCERIFLSSQKLNSLDFKPCVGDNLKILYNRWGKVDTLKKVLDADDIEVEI